MENGNANIVTPLMAKKIIIANIVGHLEHYFYKRRNMFDRHLYDRMLKKESIEDKIVNMSAGAFFLLIIISLLALVGVLYMLLTGV